MKKVMLTITSHPIIGPKGQKVPRQTITFFNPEAIQSAIIDLVGPVQEMEYPEVEMPIWMVQLKRNACATYTTLLISDEEIWVDVEIREV